MSEKTVLFICVENACRSLMAEAMFNAHPPEGWRAISAGTAPASEPNPRTSGMLREVGLDVPPHAPQLLTNEMMTTSRVVITMGCLDSDSCPARLKTLEVIDWSLPDPAQLDDAGFRKVRDEIADRTKRLRLELVLQDRRRQGTPTRSPNPQAS